MGRYYGQIGFLKLVEGPDGVYREQISERNYYGDILSNTTRYEASGYLNDNLALNEKISIVADSFAVRHIGSMKYLKRHGVAWTIKSIEQAYPRLIITVGSVYNEPTT